MSVVSKIKLPSNTTVDIHDARVSEPTSSDSGKVLSVTDTSGTLGWVTPSTEIYWCTYGTTTFAELTTAWNEGKQILCFWSNRVYSLIYVGASFTFGYVWGSTTYRLACSASSVWSNTSDSNQSQITASGLLKGNGSGSVTAAVAGTDYQQVLVSGTNLKTINNESLLGSGNISVAAGAQLYTVGSADYLSFKMNGACVMRLDAYLADAGVTPALAGSYLLCVTYADDELAYYVSGIFLGGTDFNGIDYESDIVIGYDESDTSLWYVCVPLNQATNTFVYVTVLSGGQPSPVAGWSDDQVNHLSQDLRYTPWTIYQSKLISGTNIKTINNESLLGSGNITIQGGGGSSDAVLYTVQTLTTVQQTQARTNIAAVGYNVTSTGTPVVLGLEQTTNKVTSLSASSTDTQYPSAKCVYDYIDDTVGDIATLLAAI